MSIIHSPKKILLIIAMVACYAIIFIDESGIAVTLPTMQQAIGLSNNALHWVINSYLLTLSVLLLLGGKLSDIYGHRRIFSLGIIIFLLASLICAVAQTHYIMLTGRILQGIGASLLMPCITVIVHRHFPREEFGKAFGIIVGFSNLFYALGPFIGGVLTQYLSWGWFFGINIPIGIICLFCTYLTVTADKGGNTHFTDIKGLLTFMISISTLVFAVMQGGEWGWSSVWVLVCFAVALISAFYFVKIEWYSSNPLLDLRLFVIKKFFSGNLILLCCLICLTLVVFLALWLQISLRFSPATVGVALLPTTLTFIFVPALAGAWHDKAGSRPPLLIGCLLILSGLIWIAATMKFESYPWLIPGLIAFGLGIPLAIPNSILSIMKSVPSTQSGMASGTFTTVRQFGLTMGVALLSAIVSSTTDTRIYTHSLFYGVIVMTLFAGFALGLTLIYQKVR
ncbi:MFS transporter [Coxiella burnetii]|uniref:MFS transporter n=1 Tax=Coxiella burnetii TaxID=777 RepID=UPI000183CD61|nr:MFS transporter [Coxiella burnetii]ACJ18120.1 multidrug resistance protein B [Coxiella burnetii CbuG_Q212]ATN66520.1 MFS transporter [Coxiella burnetii]OYK86567.1 MFS transporter [Coxiella burnetii]